MSPVAILSKAAAIAAVLIGSAAPSAPDRRPLGKALLTKTIVVHCRMYFGCAPTAQTPAGQVQE
jgi:hypothetical protein